MNGDGSAGGLLHEPALDHDAGAPPEARPEQDVPIGPDAGIMAIMSTTRAMRHLAPDPVPDELLRTLVEAATWGPSPGNWQPAAYVVVTERETMARLAVLWRRVIEDFRLATTAAGLGAVSTPSSARTEASIDYQRDHFAETPALIVVCEDRSAIRLARGKAGTFLVLVRRAGLRRSLHILRAWPRGKRGEAAAFYPPVQNLLLAARANGLAACLTTWHLFAEDEFKEIVGIPKDVRTWAVVPVGWPLRRFGPVRRRPVDEVIHRERW